MAEKNTQENVEIRLALVESYLDSEFGRGSKSEGNTKRSQRLAIEEAMTRIQKLEHAIEGNGQIGIKTRVLIMWHTHYWLWGAVGMVIGGAIVKFSGLGG